ALSEPASIDNLRLQARDELYIFTRGAGRQEQLSPILTELQVQAVRDDEAAIAEISGAVRMPGRYPYTPGMKIADLVRIAGGLAESAYTLGAELNRYRVVDGKLREVDHANFVLADALAGKPDVNVPLQPHDRLVVKPVTNWGEQEFVTISGEVRFPGTYTIRKGEALSSVLKRAGGVTTHAFPKGAVFTRESLRQREQEQLDKLATRIEADLAQSQLEKTQSPSGEGNAPVDKEAIAVSRNVVQQIRSTKALGRLVIDLPALLAGPQIAGLSRDAYEEIDISLQPGDRLVIPRDTQEVTVLGEVFHGTSHLFRSGIARDEYIRLSGGATRKGDLDNIFIVKANGTVIGTGSGLLGSGILARTSTYSDIEPGDTIIVPLDIERVKPLAFWSEVTKILGQVGLSVAAFHSVGVL
ncbi:MAG: SLBB domain-containing protein, partial [Bacteroidetes bacterium]|nr:SLBB domain-containing protein [Bacteroidota bacterium]